MSIHASAAAAAALLAPLPATAGEATVARIIELQGNVLVSRGYQIASATEALRLAAETRLIATGNSTATIEFDDGCRVRLLPGDRLEVRSESPCATLAAHSAAHAPAKERQP
jgi:hypothetical protein